MSNKVDPITKTKQAEAPKKASGDNILKKVVSVNLKNIDKATIKDITDNIIDNADLQDNALKNSSKKSGSFAVGAFSAVESANV